MIRFIGKSFFDVFVRVSATPELGVAFQSLNDQVVRLIAVFPCRD
ncbi:hypothetical protein RSSM_06605 [Rhodopirellula sallentina SM41]|uniref:Uncharacterized protein n=1 Tax=Rhodopirellula sallentina SM41 TaxID=1263870 RepID=M5TS08_9BACT|nr:hypothetical protein RSSM_06605 [Rhodopirellula sallentina SM41]